MVLHGEVASNWVYHGGGDGDGGGGLGGDGGDGGGEDGGGRGGKITVASVTLRVLGSTPRFEASDDVTLEELSVVAVAASASVADPSMVMLMVTEVDVTMGVATLTLWPSALASDPVRALVSAADSVAFELRLLPEPAGIEISKVICVLWSRRPSTCRSCKRRLEAAMPTVHPAG